ncbi:MAG: PAS domain S-box protein [Chloroflexota bacterium]
MSWQIVLYFCSILSTGALTGFLAWYAWRQPRVTGARSYAYMVLAESLLALTELGSMLAGAQTQALFWFSLRVPFTAFIPVFWLFFAMEYNGRSDWLSKPVRVALFAIPLITQVVMLTGSLHGLWLVQDVGFEKIGPFWIADTSARIPGFWYLVHTFYSTLLLVAGAGVLVVAAWRKPKHLFVQALLVSLGALTALGLALVGVFDLLPDLPFNPFVPGIGFSALCYALAIFRFQFLKHTPTQAGVARLTRLEPQEKRSLAIFIFVFILMASGLAAISMLTYQNYEKHFRAQMDNQLEAIASLKTDELRDWRDERLADANLFYRNENFSERTQNYLEAPGDAEAQAKLLTWMEKIAAFPEYNRVFLLDPRGVERLSIPSTPEAVPPELAGQASASLASGQIVFLDFHRHAESDAVHLSMLVPIYDAQGNLPLGVLVLRIDPNTYLYPFILRWPVPSESGETLLLRREGLEVVYLNSLRFQPNAALDLRLPLTETRIPAVRAALGETGMVEGLDYRGVEVIADMRAVPNSPWFMVSKMDTAEVYAPLRARQWQTILLFGALILASGTGLMLVWRQQRVRYYRAQVETLEALRLSEEKFRLAFETSPDSVAITRARDGLFVSVNKGFEQISGYKREEVVGKTSLEVNIWKDPQDRRNVVEALQATGEVRNYEAPFLVRDGEIIGMMSAAIVQLEGEPHILNITRDITARKRAEAILHENETNLSALIENTDGSIWAVDRQYRLIVGNREFYRNTSAALGRNLEMGESVLLPGFPPEANAEWQGLYDRALQGESFTFEMNTRFREPPHYIEYHFSPIREEPDEIRGVTVFGRDITERKQAEEALRQLNDRLALAQRLAGAGVWDWDLATGKLNWTPEFFSLFGLDPATSDATFDTWRGVLYPDDIQIAEQRINEAIRDHVPLFNEYRIVTPSGETRWIGAWGDTTYNERGEALRMTGLCIDITERKRAEKAIQESESKYRGLIQNMKVGMVVHQPDTSILLSNPMASQLLGLTADQMRGKTAIDPAWHFIREDGTPFSLEEYPVNRALSSNQPAENMVLGIVRPDLSRPIWVQCDAYQVRGVDGRLQQIVVTFFDITERKQAEEALRESEIRFRTLVEQAPTAIFVQTRGMFTYINPAALALFGAESGEQLLDRPVLDQFHPSVRGQVQARIRQLVEDRQDVPLVEETILRLDGAPVEVEVSAVSIYFKGEHGALVFARDITERNQAREQLLATLEELKRSNAELEQFAYVASHDLQEPLRAVAGMVQLLQQRYHDQLDQRANEYIHLAVDGATRMQTLINDLLAYSRVERRGSPMKPTDAAAALHTALRNLEAAILESGAVITHGGLPTLEADATQLAQVFQNLVGNAIKFRGEAPPQIHVEARDLGEAWQFSIRDNGIGIEPQYFERVFLVFQRLHTRRVYPGTGIGLSICKKIIERHGGRIWIESTPGQGATFHFTIPNRR